MPYTRYDIDDLKRLMEDRWDSTPFWDEDEATYAINEALLVWNSLTGFWRGRETVTLVSGQSRYNLSSTMVFGVRVEYQSSPMGSTSTTAMDSAYPGWEADTGNPRKWMPIDMNTIQVWPTPDSSGASLTVDGVAATPQLVYDTDTVQIGADALNAIVGYALHAVSLKEGGERFNTTMKYFEEFLNAAAVLNKQLTLSATFRSFLGLDLKREEQPTR